MSLANLTIAELQNLLMEETKRLTTAMREGYSSKQKEEIKNKIDQIIQALEEKNPRGNTKNHLANR
jgi:hypothetical protein